MPARTRTATTRAAARPPESKPAKARRWSAPRTVDPADPFTPNSNAVYRLYNAVDALLYVGISDHPKRRFGEHHDDKPWWREVHRWEVEWFPNRALAEAEEATAIRDEVPAFNLKGIPTALDDVDLHRVWTDHFRRYRPNSDDLIELHDNAAKIRSLQQWPQARLPMTLDAAEGLYAWARQQAGLADRMTHRRWLASEPVHSAAPLPDWTRPDGLLLRWTAALVDPWPRQPRIKPVKPYRPPMSVRAPSRVGAETFAGMSGLRCRSTELLVHECDCSSRHIVSAFEERRFGLPLGAPFGVAARPWKNQTGQRGVMGALRRYAA